MRSAGFLATGVIAGSRTAYRAIVPLPPGHTLVIRRGGKSSLRRLILPRQTPRSSATPERVIEGYRAVLQDAVAERAAARTSVLMSGGVDSTTIAAAARAVAGGHGPARVHGCLPPCDHWMRIAACQACGRRARHPAHTR